jgi:hypothetical protein
MCDMQSYGIDDDLLSYLPRHSQGVDSHHSRDVSDGSAVLEYPTPPLYIECRVSGWRYDCESS